jgi:hypothetical protein
MIPAPRKVLISRACGPLRADRTVLRCAGSFQNLAIAIPIERDSGALKRLEGTPMLKTAYFVCKVILVAFVAVVQNVLLLAIGVPVLRPHPAE